jgi:hypothetical protein
VAAIIRLLAAAKASAILREYDDGAPVVTSFRIRTEFGVLTFRLPAKIDGVRAIPERSSKIPRSLRDLAQARRVPWRIVFHWLEEQLALIQAGLATLDQVFLPYCQDRPALRYTSGMRQAKFSGLLLEEGEKKITWARKLVRFSQSLTMHNNPNFSCFHSIVGLGFICMRPIPPAVMGIPRKVLFRIPVTGEKDLLLMIFE